jgi:hypothetical protein
MPIVASAGAPGGPPAASAPDLSVIVPSVNGWGDLEGCLDALVRLEGVAVEAIVPERCGGAVRSAVARTFPAVRVLPVEPHVTIPQMRALAFAEAHGAAVAVIEDHVVVPPRWGRQLLDALAEGHQIVGGPVENAATTTLIDWAAFFCEYSHCMPPLAGGPAEWLPGNNVVYRAELLARYAAVVREGQWENRLHDAARADGIRLMCKPDLVVGHKKHYTFGEYFSQRYLYARSYAGARVSGAPFAKRLVYGAAATALPALLMARTIGRVRMKPRPPRMLARSVPLLALFVSAWAAGEAVGYLFGPGTALQQVK